MADVVEGQPVVTLRAPRSPPRDEPDAGGDEPPAGSDPSPTSPAAWRGPGADRGRRWFLLGLLGLVGGVPAIVALGAVRQPHWYPAMDLALTEMLVRGVGSGDPPLLGLVGRLNGLGQRGSHPGPMSFYLLWPAYRLLGSSAWALLVATAGLNVAGMGVALWVAERRGGRLAALAMAALLTALAAVYGTTALVEPWNPYLPLMWWVAFLLLAWSLLCGDHRVFPLAAVAGTLCVQTHVPYVPLVGSVSVVVAGVLAVRAWRRRPGRPVGGVGGVGGKAARRWAAGTLVLLGVLWAAPIVEQVTGDPGNVSVLRAAFDDPAAERVGLTEAVGTWLAYLDVPTLVRAAEPDAITADDGVEDVAARRGATLPGLVTLAVWAAAAGVAWRRRRDRPDVLRLHVVAGTASAAGFVAITRIQDGLARHVVMWAWGTTVVVLLAVGATAWAAWADRVAPRRAAGSPGARPAGSTSVPTRRRRAVAVLAAVVLIGAGRLTVEAARTPLSMPLERAAIEALAPSTVARLRSGDLPGTGPDGAYLVRWATNFGFGDAAPFGLVLELERQGLDVGTERVRFVGEVPYRWRDLEDATAVLYVAVGPDEVTALRQDPTAVEVAVHPGPTSAFAGNRGPAAVFVLPPR